MDSDPEFEALMNAGGVYQAHVLTWLAEDWEVIEELCAQECTSCSREIRPGPQALVWCWPEPFGKTHVAISTHCSEECVVKTIHKWLDRQRPEKADAIDLYISYHAMNWHYEEDHHG